MSLGRDQNPLGMFPLPGDSLAGAVPAVPPEVGARRPVSLAASERVNALTFQRRWPGDLAVIECRSEASPLRVWPSPTLILRRSGEQGVVSRLTV